MTPRLILPFLLSLASFVGASLFIPSLHLNFFAPFLAMVYQRKSLVTSLWAALFCGLIFDLLTTEHKLGLFAIASLISCPVAYRFRGRFYLTHLFSIPSYSFLISWTYGLSTTLIFYRHFTFSGLLQTLFLTPFLDAFYGFFVFTCTMILYQKVKRGYAH